MKKIIYLLICSLTITTFAQDLVSTIPLELKKRPSVFQIVNESNKQVTLFLSDKNGLNAVRLNDKMAIIDSLSAQRPEKKFGTIVGYNSSQENNSRIFWATSNRKEFFIQNFDFVNRKVSSQNYNLTLKNEELVQEFTANSNFYLMTIVKKTNDLKLYIFDSEGKLEEKIVNLDSVDFFNEKSEKITFHAILNTNLLPFEPGKMQQINSENPISLTESAKKRKLYISDNQINITLDIDPDYTQLLTINLDTFTTATKMFKKPFIETTEQFLLNSNSFLIDDKLFQLKSSYDHLYLSIKDMEDNKLQEFHVTKDSSIDFNNTEVIQENGDPKKRRILDKSSQFLRKVNNQNSGVSCYKLNNNYIVTIGSVSQEGVSDALMVGAMFGVVGVLVATAVSNPTYDSFNSYSNRKVIYTNGLFDLNGKHLDGTIAPFAFDKIREYLNNNKNLDSKTLYKLDNSYYLGYYNTADKNYNIRKFQD